MTATSETDFRPRADEDFGFNPYGSGPDPIGPRPHDDGVNGELPGDGGEIA